MRRCAARTTLATERPRPSIARWAAPALAMALFAVSCSGSGSGSEESRRPGDKLEEARQKYPPELAGGVLAGRWATPPGFDSCVTKRLGAERLAALRSAPGPHLADEVDVASLCLLELAVPPDSISNVPHVPPMACRPRGDGDNYRINQALVIDPTDPRVLYVAVEYKGVYKSIDGGATWKESHNGITGYPRADDTSKSCYLEFGKMVIDPSDPRRLLLNRAEGWGTLKDLHTEHAGLWESTDGGQSWHQLLDDWMNAGGGHHAVAIDPNAVGTIYYGSHNLPASYDEADKTKTFVTKGVLYRTTDGGQNWEELPTGLLPSLRSTHVFVDPSNGRNLLLTTVALKASSKRTEDRQLGPLRSSDGGRTWASLAKNLPAAYRGIGDASVAPSKFSHIFLSPQNTAPDPYFAFYSTDGGRSFHRTSGSDPYVAHYDPHDRTGRRLLGVGNVWTSRDLSVLSSADAGATWRKVALAPGPTNIFRYRATSIVFDPVRRGVVYLATSGPYIWRSSDGGRKWQAILTPKSLP